MESHKHIGESHTPNVDPHPNPDVHAVSWTHKGQFLATFRNRWNTDQWLRLKDTHHTTWEQFALWTLQHPQVHLPGVVELAAFVLGDECQDLVAEAKLKSQQRALAAKLRNMASEIKIDLEEI